MKVKDPRGYVKRAEWVVQECRAARKAEKEVLCGARIGLPSTAGYIAHVTGRIDEVLMTKVYTWYLQYLDLERSVRDYQ